MPRNICQMAIKKRIMTAKVIGYMKPDIDPNTRLYVPFNEGVGDLAKDYSQYCNHATLTDVEWSNDGFNGAGKFNGSSSYGNCGNDTSLNITDALSVGVRMTRLVDTGLDEWIVNKYKTVGNQRSYSLKISPNDKLLGVVSNDGTAITTITGSTSLQNGQCYYLVVVYDGSYLRLYYNGISDTTPIAYTGDIFAGTGNLLFGKYEEGGFKFNGTIDNVIVSSTAKSVAQAAADCYEVVCN